MIDPTAGRGRLIERLGGLPFYAAILLQGLPLDRHLTSVRSRIPQDAQQQLVERVTTVGATQSLVPSLTWGLLYLTALMLLLRKTSADQLQQLCRGQWPLIALIALGLGSLTWSPNVGKVIASSFHAVGITLVAMAAAARCATNPPSFLKVVALCFAANLLAHLACIAIAPDIGIAFDGRWMGMTTHSNTLGSYAFLGTWSSLTAALLHRGATRRLMWVCLAVSLVTLYGSGSTTSMLCVGAVFCLAALLRFSTRWSVELKQLANVFCICAALGVIAFVIVYGGGVGDVTSSLGRDATFTGRDQIWKAAWELILKHPLLGWGFDDNARVIVETGFIHTGYHNGYLDLGVRGGAVALTLLGVGLWLWVRGIPRAGREWVLACVPMLAAFLLHNLMEVSMFVPRNAIWLVLAMLLFSTVAIGKRASGMIRAAGPSETGV